MGRVVRGAVGKSEIDRDEDVRGEMGRTEVGRGDMFSGKVYRGEMGRDEVARGKMSRDEMVKLFACHLLKSGNFLHLPFSMAKTFSAASPFS